MRTLRDNPDGLRAHVGGSAGCVRAGIIGQTIGICGAPLGW